MLVSRCSPSLEISEGTTMYSQRGCTHPRPRCSHAISTALTACHLTPDTLTIGKMQLSATVAAHDAPPGGLLTASSNAIISRRTAVWVATVVEISYSSLILPAPKKEAQHGARGTTVRYCVTRGHLAPVRLGPRTRSRRHNTPRRQRQGKAGHERNGVQLIHGEGGNRYYGPLIAIPVETPGMRRLSAFRSHTHTHREGHARSTLHGQPLNRSCLWGRESGRRSV
jgi:hypothetical protein